MKTGQMESPASFPQSQGSGKTTHRLLQLLCRH
jgi:hypothetical protein